TSLHHVSHQLLLRLPASLLCVQPLPAILLQTCHMHSCEIPGGLLCACELQTQCVCDSLLPVLCVCACELQACLCDLHLPVIRVLPALLPIIRVLPAFLPIIRVLPALLPHPGLQTCHL
ncbi:hypothetical protein HispidOSU_026584, partial [Sigmodon hispidus]